MKKKTPITWITIICSIIVSACCLGGCNSEPDATESSLETTVPTEATREDELYVTPEDLDVFYDLESFLDYAGNAPSGGLADLASLEYFYLPFGIPEEYHLYKITAAKNNIAFWYLSEEALASDNTRLSAESRSEHFMFLSPRANDSAVAGDESILTWKENGDLLMLYLPKNFTVDNRETVCQTVKFIRNGEGRFLEETSFADAPPAEEFHTVQEVVEYIKAVKAAGVEKTVSSNHVVLYDKEYIYALKESPLPDYKQEAVMLIKEGINILYFTDGYEEQASFAWYKGLENDERINKLTERYSLKQYKDTKFYFEEMFEDPLIYWWENGDEFRFRYPAKTNVPPEKIIEHLEVEKYVFD